MAEMKNKKSHLYIFPDVLGTLMSKVDLRVQLEASMMSMTLMMCGLIVTGVYFTFYMTFPLWFKIIFVINIVSGVVFMSSYLTTTFQQYNSYLEAMEFQESLK